MPAWWNSVWPVITFFVGIASNFFLGALGAWWQTKRERDARDADRDKARRDRREAFELDSLDRLHDVLVELSQAMHNAKVKLAMSTDPDGTSDPGVLTERDYDAIRTAQRSAVWQAERVLDPELRRFVVDAAFDNNAGMLAVGRTLDEADKVYGARGQKLTQAIQRVNARIRGIYLAWDIPLEPSPTPTSQEPST